MADEFQIVPYRVRSAGTDVPPEEVQAGLNSLAFQVQVALNILAGQSQSPTGPAGGDLGGTYPNPQVVAVHATSGSLTGVSIINGTVSGTTGITGTGIDNTTALSTNAFVNQQIIRFSANVPLHITGGTYNQAVTGTGVQFVIFASGGVISSVVSVITGGINYAVGDMLLVQGGNYDARLRVTNVVGGAVQSGGLEVLYGGTGYSTGATVQAADVPPGQRTITMTGILTSNVTYILANGTFNNASRRPEFVNNTTGAFTITVKISNGLGGSTGTGVVLPQGTNDSTAVTLMTDGSTDVWLATPAAGIGAAVTSGTLAQFAPTTSAQLAGVISDETGSGSLVFGTNPTISGATTTGGTINNTPVGATTPSTGSFTTLAASGAVSGAGFTARFASPGPIGSTAASTGAFTTLSSTGTFTPSSTNGIVGTTTNDNANAGSVGEIITNTTTGTSVSTGVVANATSVSLTAGDWDVTGVAEFLPAGTTTTSAIEVGVSTTSAAFQVITGSFVNVQAIFGLSVPGGTNTYLAAPVTRISVASTTTVFLPVAVAFAVSTMTVNGFIRARRVR